MHAINSEAELFRTERMREKLDEIKGTHISKNNILGEIISNYELRLEIKKLTMALMIEVLKKQKKLTKKILKDRGWRLLKDRGVCIINVWPKHHWFNCEKREDFRWKTNGNDNINFSWLMLAGNVLNFQN